MSTFYRRSSTSLYRAVLVATVLANNPSLAPHRSPSHSPSPQHRSTPHPTRCCRAVSARATTGSSGRRSWRSTARTTANGARPGKMACATRQPGSDRGTAAWARVHRAARHTGRATISTRISRGAATHGATYRTSHAHPSCRSSMASRSVSRGRRQTCGIRMVHAQTRSQDRRGWSS